MSLTISKAKIANMALSNIGTRSTIEDLTEQSTEARQCNLHYDYARAVALSSFPWSFARKRVTLATHDDDPPSDWTYRYQYPADCLVAREIENPLGPDADKIPFQVEMSEDGTTKSILADVDDAVLIYTFDQETTSLFSAYFVRTLSFMLSHLIAYALTGKQSISTDMWNQFQFLVQNARASDGNESVGRAPRDAPGIRARGISTFSALYPVENTTPLPDASN